jgi:CDP-4-dehydro-6-deoxyglucose reductase
MTYTIKIKPSNYAFSAEPGESVLDAAIRHGFDFPYSCRSATCATCMGKVIKGSVNYGNIEPYALDEADQEQGFALFCSAIPESDLIIEMEDVYGPEYRPAKTVEYTVAEHKKMNSNLHYLALKPATDKKIQYSAGQYLNILLDDGIQLSFTIANAPNDLGVIELFIREVPDNLFTLQLLAKAGSSEVVTIKAPYGKVVYHKEPNIPIIFVAGGTGMVLARAILEYMMTQPNPQETVFYWGVSKYEDLILDEQFKTWEQTHSWLTYIPVLSSDDDNWTGRTGKVHEAVLADFSDLSEKQIYASGPNNMVFAASKAFKEHGLKPHWFYSDTLESIGD